MNYPGRSSEDGSAAARERTAREAGERTADEVVERYGTSDPREIAAAADVPVCDDEWDGIAGLVLLGTYDDGTVTLYPGQIEAHARERGVDRRSLTEAVVAHELGHHFVAATDRSPVAPPDRNGWLSRVLARCRGRAGPKPVREAAANGFALALLERHRPGSPVLAEPTLLTDVADG